MELKKELQIVFLGLNDIGKAVFEYLENLQVDKLYLFTQKEDLGRVKEISPDLILSVGFRYIVPKEILKIPTLGAINFHKSLLPLNRGANPVFWTILNGSKAGVTIHFMDEGIDTGNIIAQREVEVNFPDNALTLYQRLEGVQLELFKENWHDIRKGKAKGVPQSGDTSYHTVKEFKELRKNDINQKVKIINYVNYLRAMTFSPFQNSHIEVDGKRYFIEIDIKEEQQVSENSNKLSLLKQYVSNNIIPEDKNK